MMRIRLQAWMVWTCFGSVAVRILRVVNLVGSMVTSTSGASIKEILNKGSKQKETRCIVKVQIKDVIRRALDFPSLVYRFSGMRFELYREIRFADTFQ